MRQSLLDSIEKNRELRQQVQTEIKKQHQACGSCTQLRQKLRRCQDEVEACQELYFDEKTRHNEECHKFRGKLNEMRQESQRLTIEIREI